jgi:cytochrome c553
MKATFLPLVLLGLTTISTAQAANLFAGQDRAATVCAQCHGIKKPNPSSPFPLLAGRDAAYLKDALKQYRSKKRISDMMNAIAGSLRDSDIDDLVAYYSKLKP